MANDVPARTTVKDPVCGMEVVPGIARSWDYLFEKVLYHFCGPECRSRFAADPKGILASGPGRPKTVSSPPSGGEGKAWWSNLGGLFKKWRTRSS